MDRRYPDGISWDQFQQGFTDRFFPQSHKDSKIEEFFRLEQKNLSVSEYEKRFSELVRLVPYIQADEVLKCKRFLSGLQHRIRVRLSVVPQNRFGDLVEVALRVEQSTTVMYQSRQESKRSALDTSQQSSGQYNRKRSKGRGYRGRGASRGAISSQGSVRPPVASSDTQSIPPVRHMCQRRHHGECKRYSIVTKSIVIFSHFHTGIGSNCILPPSSNALPSPADKLGTWKRNLQSLSSSHSTSNVHLSTTWMHNIRR